MWNFIKRHPLLGIFTSIFFGLFGLPGDIEDFQTWRSWLTMGVELSWPFWRYLLLFISFSGIVVFSIPLLLPLKRKVRWNWAKQKHPNCSFYELKDYLTHQVVFGSFSLEASAEAICDYSLLNRFLSQKLFEGKIKAWGKEIKEHRVSPAVRLIPREYWEFNRLNFKEEEIDMHSTEEVAYTLLLFNQEQMIEQMEFLFSNYEKIQEQLKEPERDEEEYWREV